MSVMTAGCGGGGGASGSGDGPFTGEQITAYTSVKQMLDTRNLLVGDVVQLDITARDKNNNLVIFKGTGWSTNAPSNVATVSPSGVLTAVAASATPYQIQGTYQGVAYSANLVVSTQQDLVAGVVRNSAYGIESAIVDFYDGSGNLVGSSYSARDGSFRASVPATAVRFTLDMSLADPNNQYYYTEFAFGSNAYLEGTSCLAPLPTPLSSSTITALPNPIVPALRSDGPPPPPTGCIG